MSNSEFPEAGLYVHEMFTGLVASSVIDGELYRPIALSSPDPEVTDAYHRRMQYKAEHLVVYWPGGAPEEVGEDADCQTFDLRYDEPSRTQEMAAAAMDVRRLVLGASVGQAALDRLQPEIKAHWQAVEASLQGLSLIEAANTRCLLFGLPLGVILLSRVIESTDAPAGARMMHLWHPIDVRPEPVLERIQEVIQHGIDQETI